MYLCLPQSKGRIIAVFQSFSCVQLFATPWTTAHQASLFLTISWNLLKLISIKSVMPSNHLIFCRPLLLPSIFPSIRVFSNESALHIRWPRYWSFSFTIRPSKQYSGLISFRIDWFNILAVQGTLKSLLQHSSKASILQCSAFLIVQLSHLYISVCPRAQGGLDLSKGHVSVQIPSRTLSYTSLVLMKQGRVRGFLPGPFSAEWPRQGTGLPTARACPVWLPTCP